MPTIIDSLFLELGIDTSKFSADEKKALERIRQFESRTKRAGDQAATHVKRVGEAFRDIADDTSIGAAARRLDTLGGKLRGLGQSARVSGGVSSGLGMMAEGLGTLLSPAALGVAALGLLGKATWDFNEKMTAANATIFRQSQLAGMNAKNLWSWGEAAKTVGGSATGTESGIAGLQTAIAGMSIGAGNATSQIVGLARLSQYGAQWNMRTGVDIPSLFKAVHAMGKQQGWAKTWALVSNYGLMNESEFNLAMSKKGGLAAYEYAKRAAPASFDSMVRKSLESQALLGKKDIQVAALAESAYKGVQSPMQRLVGLVTDLVGYANAMLGYTIKIADWIGGIWNFIAHPGRAIETPVGKDVQRHLRAALTAAGAKPKDAASVAATATPAIARALGDAPGLIGRAVTSPAGAIGVIPQAVTDFARIFSTPRGLRNNNPGNLKFAGQPGAIGKDAQGFAIFGTPAEGVAAMRRQLGLYRSRGLDTISSILSTWAPASAGNDTAAYIAAVSQAMHVGAQKRLNLSDPAVMSRLMRAMIYDENGQDPFGAGAMRGLAAVARAANVRHIVHNSTVTHHTRIDAVNVSTQATDAAGMAAGARSALSRHPLLGPVAQNTVTLATRGAVG